MQHIPHSLYVDSIRPYNLSFFIPIGKRKWRPYDATSSSSNKLKARDPLFSSWRNHLTSRMNLEKCWEIMVSHEPSSFRTQALRPILYVLQNKLPVQEWLWVGMSWRYATFRIAQLYSLPYNVHFSKEMYFKLWQLLVPIIILKFTAVYLWTAQTSPI